MYSAFAGAQLLSTQWMSRLSDRKGRRVAFLTSFMGSVVGFFIQGLAWNVGSLLAARFLAGLFSGSAPVAMAYVRATCWCYIQPSLRLVSASWCGMPCLWNEANVCDTPAIGCPC